LSLNIWPNGQKFLVHRKPRKNKECIDVISKTRQSSNFVPSLKARERQDKALQQSHVICVD
jgi:hypothetical protein